MYVGFLLLLDMVYVPFYQPFGLLSLSLGQQLVCLHDVAAQRIGVSLYDGIAIEVGLVSQFFRQRRSAAHVVSHPSVDGAAHVVVSCALLLFHLCRVQFLHDDLRIAVGTHDGQLFSSFQRHLRVLLRVVLHLLQFVQLVEVEEGRVSLEV